MKEFDTKLSELGRILPKLPPELAVMLWSSPGTGKTSLINQTFGDEGYWVYPILAGCSDPTDFSGIPHPGKLDEKGEPIAFHHLPPHWAYLASTENPDPKPMVLFFDDVVTADAQTQAALYKATHERRIGQLEFRSDVRMVFAGNRTEDKSAANDMPLALANRMAHFHVTTDIDSWADWAVLNGVHPLIVAYLRKNPNSLNKFDPKSNAKAFATPRSWHLLSNGLLSLGDCTSETRFKIAGSIVGQGTASHFNAFAKVEKELIDPRDIIKAPDKCKVPNRDKIDVMHVTIANLEAYVNQNKKFSNAEAAMIWANRLIPEMGSKLIMSMNMLVMRNFTPGEKAKMIKSEIYKKVKEKMAPYYDF